MECKIKAQGLYRTQWLTQLERNMREKEDDVSNKMDEKIMRAEMVFQCRLEDLERGVFSRVDSVDLGQGRQYE